MHGGGSYSTRLLTRADELDEVADDWERVWSTHAHAQVNQHLESLRRDHPDVDGKSAVWAVVLKQDEKIVGVAPLLLTRRAVTWKIRLARTNRTVLRFGVTAAEFCGDELMAPDNEQAREALIDGLMAACQRFAVVRFPYIRGDAEPCRSLSRRRTGHWVWVSERDTPVLTVRLASDFATYTHSLPKKRRDNFRRESRILSDAGEGEELQLIRVTEPTQVPRFLDLADQVFVDSWHAERGASRIRRGDRSIDRYTWLAERGWLRGYVLCKGDEPLAFIIGQQCARSLRVVRTAFSSRWAHYSPGKALWFRVLEDLHGCTDIDELNFGYGDWEYKRVLANGGYPVHTLEVIRPGIRNALVWSGPVVYRTARTAGIKILRRLKLDDRVARWSRKRLAR